MKFVADIVCGAKISYGAFFHTTNVACHVDQNCST